ncbi:MAG: hypothetical protein V3R14_00105, partial [Nitrospinaceae bacterium]
VILFQGSAMALRTVGIGFRHAGQWLTHVYDIFIFLPLWIERMVKKQPNQSGEGSRFGMNKTKLEVGEVTK